MNSWIEQLQPIMKEYMDGDTEPMDGDAVDDLIHILKAKINLNQGNITEDDYNNILSVTASQQKEIDNASHYLCDFEDDDGNINDIHDQLILIKAVEDGSMRLDDVEGVMVWEAVEWQFTVDSFLDSI